MSQLGLHIDGRWVEPHSPSTLPVINRASEMSIASIAVVDTHDVGLRGAIVNLASTVADAADGSFYRSRILIPVPVSRKPTGPPRAWETSPIMAARPSTAADDRSCPA
jgi:hypothetical protein